MSELIEKRDAYHIIEDMIGLVRRDVLMDAYDTLIKLPTIDAVPVVHGYWMTKTVRGDYVPCCSECGCGNGTLYEYDYCPNCGARMDKPEPPKEDEHGN